MACWKGELISPWSFLWIFHITTPLLSHQKSLCSLFYAQIDEELCLVLQHFSTLMLLQWPWTILRPLRFKHPPLFTVEMQHLNLICHELSFWGKPCDPACVRRVLWKRAWYCLSISQATHPCVTQLSRIEFNCPVSIDKRHINLRMIASLRKEPTDVSGVCLAVMVVGLRRTVVICVEISILDWKINQANLLYCSPLGYFSA